MGCEPSENPRSAEPPPSTQGKSRIKGGWSARTANTLGRPSAWIASLTSKVKVVRPPAWYPTFLPFSHTVA